VKPFQDLWAVADFHGAAECTRQAPRAAMPPSAWESRAAARACDPAR
jgi:hypothetical protein